MMEGTEGNAFKRSSLRTGIEAAYRGSWRRRSWVVELDRWEVREVRRGVLLVNVLEPYMYKTGISEVLIQSVG